MTFLKTSDKKWAKAITSRFAPESSRGLGSFAAAVSLLLLSVVARAETEKILPANFLPLVTYFDVVQGEVHNWWAENQSAGDMAQVSRGLQAVLAGKEYVNPVAAPKSIPEDLRKTELNAEQMQTLARLYEVPVVIAGDVYMEKSPVYETGRRLKVHLRAQYHLKTIGELWRVVDLSEPEMEKLNGTWNTLSAEHPVAALFTEIVAQIREKKTPPNPLQKKLELVLTGKLNQSELEKFKSQMKAGIKGLSDVREKSFENEQVGLALDYSGANIENLKVALIKTPWRGFRTQLVSSDSEKIFFDVKTENNK